MSSNSIAKRIFHIALFLALLMAAETVLTFLLEPLTYQMTLGRELRKADRSGKEVGIILIGDSTIRAGLDPDVFDRQLETNVFTLDAGTSSQSIKGSYYYLKDLLRRYSPEKVVLGISYEELLQQKPLLKKELIVYDRLKSPWIRADYALHTLTPEELPFLLKSYRYRDNFSQIPENISAKWKLLTGRSVQEMHMGFVPLEKAWDLQRDQIGFWDYHWTERSVSDETMTYLDRIVRLCGKKNVKLYFVTMPMASSSFYQNDSVTNAHDFIQAYADKVSVPYFDMNLWKGAEARRLNERMNDYEHPSGELAEELSNVVSRIVQGENPDKFLYQMTAQAKAAMHGILSLQMHTEPAQNGSRNIIVSCVCEEGMEVRYTFTAETNIKKNVILQKDGVSSSCILPPELVNVCSRLYVEAAAGRNGKTIDRKGFSMEVDPSVWKNQ